MNKTRLHNYFYLFTGVGLCLLAGCPTPPGPLPDPVAPIQEPNGFGGLSDKTTRLIQKTSAGVAVTGERIAAKDFAGAKVANDLTAKLLPPPNETDSNWFRSLCEPNTSFALLVKAQAENAALLDEVKTLQIRVANGISPEEAEDLANRRADARAVIESEKWRDRIIYGLGGLITLLCFGAIGLGIYLMPSTNGRKLVFVGGGLTPCAGFLFSVPGFLKSAAFQRSQAAVAYGSGAIVLALLCYGGWQVHKWIRDAKTARAA